MRRLCFGVGALAVLLALTAPVGASPITLTFEGLQDQEQILNFYNGGLGSKGSGPGPNDGVVFTSDVEALLRKFIPPSGLFPGAFNFSNNPSGNTIAFFFNGTNDVMNVAGGFNTGFSFFYSASNTGSVEVWSGLDGTGTKLKTINLGPTGNSFPFVFDSWTPVGVSFAGTAESVVFNSNAAQQIGLDDITIGSQTPSVPEPASIVLLGLGGAGMIGYRLRRKSA